VSCHAERCINGQPSQVITAARSSPPIAPPTPVFIHIRHTGVRPWSTTCRKPQSAPFMHIPFSQKAHTV
jgi:hypothetical protein